MRSFGQELADLAGRSLRRELRTLGSSQGVEIQTAAGPLINFSSNDYLGFAADPQISQALIDGVRKYGAGAGASRLICGSLAAHAALESTLAGFKGTERALTFSSGYAAALGSVTALADRRDIVILDKLAHASLVDGARLSGAALRVFPHNNLDQLNKRLDWAAREVPPDGRILVITESIFSMDGDRAPLCEIIDLKDKYGALLLLDEAHAFGVCGRNGRGVADELGVADRVDIHLGTLSKAAGLSGGFIAARTEIIDVVLNKARSFIYSTAPPPALAAAADEVIRHLLAGPEGERRRYVLWENVARFTGAMHLDARTSAIVPILCGAEERALALGDALRKRGFLVPAIRYPTVARGQARLRVTLSAAHRPAHIDALIAALHDLIPTPVT